MRFSNEYRIRTGRPGHTPVFDQRSHGVFLEGTVASHQTVAHGAHHVDVAGSEPVDAGRPDGAPAQSRGRGVLARERHRFRKRHLSPNSRWAGSYDNIVAHGGSLRKNGTKLNKLVLV